MVILLFRVLVLAAIVCGVVYFISVLLRPKPRFKCATCRHAGRISSDGVMCRYGSTEVFKNPVHIENCMDHEDDPRIPGPR